LRAEQRDLRLNVEQLQDKEGTAGQEWPGKTSRTVFSRLLKGAVCRGQMNQ
jgi:hypothetical protein